VSEAGGEFHMNRSIGVATVLSLLVCAAADQRVIDFSRDPIGALPPEWEPTMSKTGDEPVWQVIRDVSATHQPKVLAQLSKDQTAGRFPLAVYRSANFKDGAASVKFKPVSGVVDQAAGLVWRYRDRNNYYVVRANALESNVVLYKVQNGERTTLTPRGLPSRSYGVKHAVPQKVWSELKIVFSGPLATVYFNGEKLFDVEDSTFTGAGRVGVWTKADSVTYFDHFAFSAR
jgi:hypothetical protein